ncbi:hypothetical protein PG985_005356 [Apiospora marii]|uniref:uncharacterized protein n=1 Tax=Apiospora marii TaxID=335849 RepID=UPI003130ECDC
MTHSYFERLPPELLLPILSNLSGLEFLDSILRASPAAYRLFDTYGAEIFEPLLSSGETTTYRWDPPRWELPPCPLPTGMTATALRGRLASHRKVVALTVGSLEYYLGLFNASKPEQLADKEFFYALEHSDGWKGDYVGAWQPDPPREPFPLRGAGPPTWVEELRVMRACWRLELFESARVGIEAGRLPWPPTVEIYEPHLRGMGADPRMFYDCMLGAPGWSRRRRGPPGHEESDANPHATTEGAHDLDAEMLTTVQTYMAENRPSLAAPDFLARARRSWRVPAPEGPGDLDVLGNVSGILLFYYDDDDASGGGGEEDPAAAESHASPIRHVSFEPFRRAGFAIWSERRLRADESFGSPTLWQRYVFECCLAAWRGVLTPEMLRERVRANARHRVAGSD